MIIMNKKWVRYPQNEMEIIILEDKTIRLISTIQIRPTNNFWPLRDSG